MVSTTFLVLVGFVECLEECQERRRQGSRNLHSYSSLARTVTIANHKRMRLLKLWANK